MRQNSNSSERYEKFVKTMSSNLSSSKESKDAEISRQMNRSQKLKRENTSNRILAILV